MATRLRARGRALSGECFALRRAALAPARGAAASRPAGLLLLALLLLSKDMDKAKKASNWCMRKKSDHLQATPTRA